ncbi:MAG: PstS family phosphate ABC transporter substrate-binding protein [Cyanobacteria bacterium P01_C01_bin.118]
MTQRQQGNGLLMISLAGLGLVAGIFGLVAWLVGGGSLSESTPSSDPNERLANKLVAPSAPPVSTEQLTAVQSVPQGLFNYGGSTTWIPVHETVNDAIANAFPEQLRYTLPSTEAPGSGTGIKMLLDGQLSFSESSRPLKDEEFASAEQRGFKLEQIATALDGIALAVHPELGVDGLTIEQVQAIYTSTVTNWSELGGPDLPITAYSRSPEAAGTAEYFLESIVNAETYGADVVFVDNTTIGVRQTLNDRGGIYYASAPEIVNQCSIYAIPVASKDSPNTFVSPFADTWRTGQDCLNQANTMNKSAFRNGDYPLTRRLFVVVKADGSTDEAAGRAYVNMLLSSEGQDLIEDAGFIGIR